MFKFIVFFVSCCLKGCLLAIQADYSIVFIHIGKELPAYAETAILQAQLFNKNCPIFLIANQDAVQVLSKKLTDIGVKIITCESLPKSAEHEKFIKEYPRSDFRDGFWVHTSERFLFLDDLIAEHKLKNVFHLENDVMLYVDLSELLPLFQNNYKGIAATFDNDQLCVPGFIFFAEGNASKKLAAFFAEKARDGHNDMITISCFKDTHGKEEIDYLPVIMPSYVEKHPLKNALGYVANDPKRFSNHFDEIQFLFDAAALGQYLGGIDGRNGPSNPGFINERAVFNASLLAFEWNLDTQNRKIPFAIFEGKKYRINNLHIHSKNLASFASVNFN